MENSLIYTKDGLTAKTIEAVEDCFAQAQRAAKLKDWPAFRRFMDEHRALCQQWQALIS